MVDVRNILFTTVTITITSTIAITVTVTNTSTITIPTIIVTFITRVRALTQLFWAGQVLHAGHPGAPRPVGLPEGHKAAGEHRLLSWVPQLPPLILPGLL